MPTPIDFHALAVPGVRELKPYEPGKPIAEVQREYGLKDIIKLASNESPLGQSPRVAPAIQAHSEQLAVYPDGNAYALKKALAAHWGMSVDTITLGNGSDEIINMLAEVLLDSHHNAIVSRHGFSAYSIAIKTVNGELRVADALGADSAMPYGHDLDAIAALVDGDTRLVFLANPNNPTGTWFSHDELTAFLEAVPADVIVVVDEAYYEYVDEPNYPSSAALLPDYPNVVVLHTFSKVYGLAGLRVGYALSHPDLAELMNRIRPPFNVNALAQVAAQISLADREHIQHALQINREGKAQLEREFQRLGLHYIPSVGNFIMFSTGHNGRGVFERLLKEGVIIRALDSYELPDFVRVSVGLPAHNRRFIDALEKVLTQI